MTDSTASMCGAGKSCLKKVLVATIRFHGPGLRQINSLGVVSLGSPYFLMTALAASRDSSGHPLMISAACVIAHSPDFRGERPQRRPGSGLLGYCFATPQTALPTSSATSRAPSLVRAMPTGRPCALPSAEMKPLSTSAGIPDGLPFANGTNTTL